MYLEAESDRRGRGDNMLDIIVSFGVGVIVGVVGLVVIACVIFDKYDDYDDREEYKKAQQKPQQKL